MAEDISIDHGQVAQATADMHDHVVPALSATAKNLDDSVQAAARWQGAAKTSFGKFAVNLHGAIQQLQKSLADITETLGQANKHMGTTDGSSADSISHAGNGLESMNYTNLH
jgi:WXG100 family type VII secretion target